MPGYSYSAAGEQTVLATPDSTISVSQPAAALQRFRVFDITMQQLAAAADGTIPHKVQRLTADGTGDAVTEVELDLDGAANDAVVLANHTVEPTYTANQILLEYDINQRAIYRWVSVGERGDIVIPKTNDAGIGHYAEQGADTYAGDVRCTIGWQE